MLVSFWHFVICYICVFCICIFVIVCLTHGNIIFHILEQSSFQKYTICWVFLALCHMLYLCICVYVYLCICVFVFFVFVCLTLGNSILHILEQSSFQKCTTCWVFLALFHILYLCICVFVYLCLCICVGDTWEYQFRYPWT